MKEELHEVRLIPILSSIEEGIPLTHEVYLDGKKRGTISYTEEDWDCIGIEEKQLVEEIGEMIHLHYEGL